MYYKVHVCRCHVTDATGLLTCRLVLMSVLHTINGVTKKIGFHIIVFSSGKPILNLQISLDGVAVGSQKIVFVKINKMILSVYYILYVKKCLMCVIVFREVNFYAVHRRTGL